MYDPGLSPEQTCRVPDALGFDTALFLDFDGTLVESSAADDDVSISPGLPDLLLGLSHRLQGAIAVLSGRSLAELDRYLAPASLAGAGLLGAELRLMAQGPVHANGLPDLNRLAGALGELYSNDAYIGVEHADGYVRVFYDAAPDRAEEISRVMNRLATTRTLEIIERDRFIEARPRGCGKGVAMKMLIEDATFRGRRPVFIGNGATDEAGFRTASAMGGFGIKVGDGPSCASHRLSCVSDLHGWLSQSLEALS